MSPVETALVFGGIPVGFVLIVWIWVFSTGRRPTPRYRPGRPYDFTPVWYLAAREGDEDHREQRAIGTADVRAVLPPGEVGGAPAEPCHRTVKGGARGNW